MLNAVLDSHTSEDSTMKRTIGPVACLLTFCLCAPHRAAADDTGDDGERHVILTAEKLEWVPNPVLPPGAKMAVLSGNPTKPGELYAIRLQLPDGYRIPPHWHPGEENVTVLSGAMRFGAGERFDPSGLKEAPAGSFTRMPKGMRHFAEAKGETVIQLHGVGPFEIHYVNATDDPRKK
jgi:quercetin dioxygenase-like cupin family protein